MAEDTSYNAVIHVLQGGKTLEVGSSGVVDLYGAVNLKSGGALDVESGGGIDIESGADIDIESGGHVDLASGGYIDIESGAYVLLPVTTASTASTITNYGLTIIASTAAKTYNIAAPGVGTVKHICVTGGSTAIRVVQRLTTAFTFNAADTKLSFNAIEDAVILLGVSATKYVIMSNVGSVGSS